MNTDISSNDMRFKLNSSIRRPRAQGSQTRQVEDLFGLRNSPLHRKNVLYRDFEITLRAGEITAVVGPSGCGKSVLLELICRKVPSALTLPIDRLSKSSLPPVAILQGELASRLDMLSRVGLSEALVMITPARLLSGGQLYRLALALALQKALTRAGTTVVAADEFASCLDPLTAENLCLQLRKLVSTSKLSLVVATPRTELLDSLQPDQTIYKPLGEEPRVVTSRHAQDVQRQIRNPNIEIRNKSEARNSKSETLRSPLLSNFGFRNCFGFRDSNFEFHACRAQKAASGMMRHVISHARRWLIQPGTIADYRKLAPFHYIAGPPAAHKRVYVIRRQGPTLDPSAPEVAAVLVVSPPVLCVRGRNLATAGRYLPGRHVRGRRQTQTQAIARLNREMECISRVIVHPVYRGLGLAVRLVRQAIADARTPLMEALAVMGRINPFFEKAGMTSTGCVDGESMRYSYYIAHTGLRKRVIDWLWEKEKE